MALIESILVIIVVVIILVILFNIFFAKSNLLITGLRPANISTKIDKTKLPPNISSNFAWSVWFFINNWNENYGEPKMIFHQSLSTGNLQTDNIIVYLDPYENNLIIGIRTFSPTTQTGAAAQATATHNAQIKEANTAFISACENLTASRPLNFTSCNNAASKMAEDSLACQSISVTSLPTVYDECSTEVQNARNASAMAAGLAIATEEAQAAARAADDNVAANLGNAFANFNICTNSEFGCCADGYTKAYSHTDACKTDSKLNYYMIPNISLQKFVNLIISVNGRTLDIYLHGKLVRTFILPNVASLELQDVYVGATDSQSFEGNIGRLQYFANSLNPQQAYNIYREGISSNLIGDFFNKYRLKMQFMEYSTPVGDPIVI